MTQWGEYGIHFSAYIASRTMQGQRTVGAAEIASTQNVDVQYAQQILQRLRKGGIIESVRGPSGGYRLRQEATNISLFDILVATEGVTLEVIGDAQPSPNVMEGPSAANGLKALWDEFKDYVDAYLRSCTLAELATRNSCDPQGIREDTHHLQPSLYPQHPQSVAA